MPATIPMERITSKIHLIRGHKVMLDRDLAELYGVETKALKQAVRRNIVRFPEDFMFELTKDEFEILRSQIVTSSWGGRRYAPCAFTEQGVAMLSSVLRSKRAVEINIAIMRVFVHLREVLADNAALRKKLEEHDEKIKYIFNILGQMLQEPEKPKKRIGFLTEVSGHNKRRRPE
jgi:phage regulator Rha-like protein